MNRDEHLMVIGMEECNEIAQRLSKALRFGLEEIQATGPAPTGGPDEALTNRERIRKEYSDLAATLEMLGISAPKGSWMDEKRAKVEKFLAYSQEVGTLRERPASETTKPVAAICPRQPNNGPHCACWSVGGICCKCREQRPASETEGT
jgi:hypothetical protein